MKNITFAYNFLNEIDGLQARPRTQQSDLQLGRNRKSIEQILKLQGFAYQSLCEYSTGFGRPGFINGGDLLTEGGD